MLLRFYHVFRVTRNGFARSRFRCGLLSKNHVTVTTPKTRRRIELSRVDLYRIFRRVRQRDTKHFTVRRIVCERQICHDHTVFMSVSLSVVLIVWKRLNKVINIVIIADDLHHRIIITSLELSSQTSRWKSDGVTLNWNFNLNLTILCLAAGIGK